MITEKRKKYEELQFKNRNFIRSIAKNADDYEEKYMKRKLNLADEFFLNKMTEIISIIIVVRFVFCENNKYYPQAFFLYKSKRKRECQVVQQRNKNIICETKCF